MATAGSSAQVGPERRLTVGSCGRGRTFGASGTHARRLVTVEETAEMAVFMASDKASGMTGTTVNLTMGRLDD